MADVTPEQVASATTWFTDKAGITATVLAIVAIAEALGIIWLVRKCAAAVENANTNAHKHWSQKFVDSHEAAQVKVQEWGARIDQFRADVKEAFGQNDDIADKVVDALNKLQLEIARMGARRGHDG